MRVYIYTLGCRLNQVESEAIADSFSQAGFEVTDNQEIAEIIIVNTCTVTSKAEQKARRMFRLFSKKAEVVVVTGCYVEVNKSEVDNLSEKVIAFSLKEKASLLDLAGHIKSSLASSLSVFEALYSLNSSQ